MIKTEHCRLSKICVVFKHFLFFLFTFFTIFVEALYSPSGLAFHSDVGILFLCCGNELNFHVFLTVSFHCCVFVSVFWHISLERDKVSGQQNIFLCSRGIKKYP